MNIIRLKLFTPDLKKQRRFYLEILELKPVRDTTDQIGFQIGNTELIFERKKNAKTYHFAINIPSNREKEALKWLKSRVSILKFGDDEIIDFKNWNAKSIYFYDNQANIVEFIARKNLEIYSDEDFGPSAFLEVSEIGLPTNSISQTFEKLKTDHQLEKYWGNFDEFCAIGNEHGLFICVDLEKKKWFPSEDKVYPSEFEMEFINKGKRVIFEYHGIQ